MSTLLASNPLSSISSSLLLSSPRSPSLSLPQSFPIRTRRRSSCPFKGLRVQGSSSSSNVTPNEDSKPPNGNTPKNRREILLEYVRNVQPEFMELFMKRAPQQPKNRREILLEYVRNVQPEFMELFMKRAPQQVVDAMRQTVTNMIGSLPPQFFAVTVTTVAENLAQLMYSVMMTGYMFRNAQYRLELQQCLEQLALPDAKDTEEPPDYAPGTQKKVTGEVIRWNKTTGPEKIDAIKYIEFLEAELEELNHQLKRKSATGYNELLEYLKSLEPQNLKELTSSAGEDVLFAMSAFITRLLTVSDPGQMKTTVTKTTAPELANLLFWLMVVGYSIRNIEVHFDMERMLGAPTKISELPPGENI